MHTDVCCLTLCFHLQAQSQQRQHAHGAGPSSSQFANLKLCSLNISFFLLAQPLTTMILLYICEFNRWAPDRSRITPY